MQAAEGTTYALVPFVTPKYIGCVSAWVGAGGNAGALLFVKWFYTYFDDPLKSFELQSIYIFLAAASV